MRRAHGRRDDRRILVQNKRFITFSHADLCAAAACGRNPRKSISDFPGQPRQLLHVAASRLRANLHPVRHDVGSRAAFDQAHVAGGFEIDAALGNRRQGFSRQNNSVDAFLRRHPGVGAFPPHHDVDRVLPRRHVGHAAHLFAVEGVAEIGPNFFRINLNRAIQTRFLRNREHDHNLAMRQVFLPQPPQRLQDRHDPGFAVGAEDGVAGGGDHAIVELRSDSRARRDRVHMRAEHEDRRAGHRSRQAGDEIAGVAADLFP